MPFVFLGKKCIPIEDCISISVPKQCSKASIRHESIKIIDATSPVLNEEFTHKSITINYVKRLIDSTSCDSQNADKNVNKWRKHSVTFYNNDKMIVKEWFDTLSKVLSGKEMNFNEFHKAVSLTIFFSAKPTSKIASVHKSIWRETRRSQALREICKANIWACKHRRERSDYSAI